MGLANRLFGKGYVKKWVTEFPQFTQNEGLIGVQDPRNTVSKRKITNIKLKKAKKLLRYLGNLPWVRFVAVAGSVAFGNPEAEDDIDIFIVTNKKRLWLVRSIDLILYRILGVRRRFSDSNVKDKLCFIYYVTEEHLELAPQDEQNFLTALEVVTLVPVVHEEYYQKLLNSNRWVKKYFPGVDVASDIKIKAVRIPLIEQFFDLLDFLAMKLQIQYMKLKGHPHYEVVLERNVVKLFPPEEDWKKREKKFKEILKRNGLS